MISQMVQLTYRRSQLVDAYRFQTQNLQALNIMYKHIDNILLRPQEEAVLIFFAVQSVSKFFLLI